MSRVFWLLFTMISVTVAGICVVAIVATPSLAPQAKSLIPMAALAGIVVGGAISYVLAKKIAANIA